MKPRTTRAHRGYIRDHLPEMPSPDWLRLLLADCDDYEDAMGWDAATVTDSERVKRLEAEHDAAAMVCDGLRTVIRDIALGRAAAIWDETTGEVRIERPRVIRVVMDV